MLDDIYSCFTDRLDTEAQGARRETSAFFGVDGVLRRQKVLRSDNHRRRLYLNE
jgi:hypothetical protein